MYEHKSMYINKNEELKETRSTKLDERIRTVESYRVLK